MQNVFKNKIPADLKPYEKAIYYHVSRYFPNDLNGYDDILQTACMAVYEALRDFDNTKKTKLFSFINLVLHNKLCTLLFNNKEGHKTKTQNMHDFKQKLYLNPDILDMEMPKTPYDLLVEKEEDAEAYSKLYVSLKRKLLDEKLNEDAYLLTKNNYLNKRIFIDHYYNNLTYKQLEEKYDLNISVLSHKLYRVCCHIRSVKPVGGVNYVSTGQKVRGKSRRFKDNLEYLQEKYN